MFTGIIEKTTRILEFQNGLNSARIQVDAVLENIKLGESIAINGVCLTVVALGPLSFEISPETLRSTTLGNLKTGNLVNLERALQLGDRLSGHWVQGHVDGRGKILKLVKNTASQNQIFYTLEVELENPALGRYLVPKGSITIDGVSLTLNTLDAKSFSIQLIPHTFENTCFLSAKVGDLVNIEIDILSKYVAAHVSHERG